MLLNIGLIFMVAYIGDEQIKKQGYESDNEYLDIISGNSTDQEYPSDFEF